MRSFFFFLLSFEIFFSSSSPFPYTIGVVLTIPTSSSDLLDTELTEGLRSILKFWRPVLLGYYLPPNDISLKLNVRFESDFTSFFDSCCNDFSVTRALRVEWFLPLTNVYLRWSKYSSRSIWYAYTSSTFSMIIIFMYY